MASLLSGLGRGIGAAAQGYLGGENKGEAEAYRRSQIDEDRKLKLQLLGLKTRPEAKEELPYEVKSFIDTRQRVYGPTGTAEERNQWEQSGSEKKYNVITHSLAYGPHASRLAYAILNQPEGSDTADLERQFQAEVGRRQGPMLGGAPSPAAPSTPESRDTQLNAPGTDGGFAASVRPSAPATPFTYTPGANEAARTAAVDQSRLRSEALTPQEVATLIRNREHTNFVEGLAQRDFNLKDAQQQFAQAMEAFKARSDLGQKDFAAQGKLWSDLLSASVRLQMKGGDAAAMLKPLLFQRGLNGQETPNPAAIKQYLDNNGVPPADQAAILAGFGGGGALMGGGVPPPGPTGPAALGGGSGGPPVLPAVGGATDNPALSGAQSFTQGAGFVPTPNPTGLRPDGSHGGHNPGSLHYDGRALDVGVWGKNPAEVKRFMQMAQAQGYVVRDERTKPKGQAVWGGPHLHLEWGPNTKPGAAQALGFTPPAEGGGQGQPEQPLGANVGINTPATSQPVRNPYAHDPKSLESQIFTRYTSGVPADQIIASLKGTGHEAAAQSIIDYANTLQREGGVFSGIPVPDRNGARVPVPPDTSGLGYPVGGGVAKQQTEAVEPTAGFGGQPALSVEMPGVAPEPPPIPGPAATPAPTAPAPKKTAPAGGPNMLATRGRGLPAGPNMLSRKSSPGTDLNVPASRIPADNRGKKAEEAASGLKVLQLDLSKLPKIAGPDDKKAQQNIAQEVARYKRHELAPGVQKWLSKHKISRPAQQRQVYQFAIDKLGKEVTNLPARQRSAKLFRLLEERLKPAS